MLILIMTGSMAACGDSGGDPAASSQEANKTITEKIVSIPGSWFGRKPVKPPVAQSEISKAINTLEANGTIPVLDRSDSLQGPDINNNGIRDDIDAFIATKNLSTTKLSVAQRLAAAFQLAVTVDLTNQSSIQQVTSAVDKALSCGVYVYSGQNDEELAKLVSELEQFTTNTKIRLIRYIKYNEAMDGTMTPVEEPSCD